MAVVGSGVSGLTAAYVLRTTHDVTLFEADDRLGGHADTHQVEGLAVDTGFIVHNARTYPTLLRLFAELGVETRETDMSMSVRCDGCGLEYSGGQGAAAILAQGAGVLRRPRFLFMLTEVLRFHRNARQVLAAGETDDMTMSRFLAAGRYSRYFTEHFVTPLIAAVWSCAPRTALEYPARYLFAFLDNHGMLSVGGSPRWRTVVGGSRTYVERAAKELHSVRTATPVRSVRRTTNGVQIMVDDAGPHVRFDAVVLAAHPDQSLRMLARPTAAEQAVLGAFRYTPNPAVLHTDSTVLPREPRAQASWNYRMPACSGAAGAVQVTYDMTRLQGLPGDRRYLVSLNADPHPESVVDTMAYAHPQYSPESVAAQNHLPSLNDGTVAFAGAYHGWGFHEDGARSGVAAALSLGGRW